jgi:hypothetical protein
VSFLFVEIDPFDPAAVQSSTGLADIPVRRPIMGLVSKRQVFSKIQVLEPQSGGIGLSWVPVFNSSTETGYGDGTSNFFLSRARIPLQERIQITPTFERDYLYAFGKAPTMIEIVGVLLNSADFPWTTEWLRNYEQHFRASQTLDRAARLYLTVDDLLIEGHMLRCEISKGDESNLMTPMAFVMYVSDIIYTGTIFRSLTEEATDSQSSREGDVLYAHSVEYLEGPGGRHPVSLLGESNTGLPGEFFVDTNGNITLQSVGGITSRSVQPDLFQRLEVEQMVAAAVHINENLGGNLNVANIRKAFELVRLAKLGFGFGSAESLGEDAMRLRRLLSSGTGGYMGQLSAATDELAAAFEDL